MSDIIIKMSVIFKYRSAANEIELRLTWHEERDVNRGM